MPEHAYQALPRLTFLFAQRAAEVRQNQQIMRHAALAEYVTPHAPTSGESRKTSFQGPC